jgi:hypothetical protein
MTAIKAGYAAASMAREAVAETSESVQDLVVEARAKRGPVNRAPLPWVVTPEI